MKVQLNHDPLFDKNISPVKQLKQRERERQKQLRIQKANISYNKKDRNFEIIDPSYEQLKIYKDQFQFKKNLDASKASQKLKKYIIQQQRNLKCLRLEKLDPNQDMESSKIKRSYFKPAIQSKTIRQDDGKNNKQIHIPQIQQMFRYQHKQYMLWESKMMRNQLTKAMEQVDSGVAKVKSYSFGEVGAAQGNDTRKSTTDKFPNILGISRSITHSSHVNQQQYQIDKVIQKKLILSQKLREKLDKQKKQILNTQSKQSSQKNSLNFFQSLPKKTKKKITLKGVKSVPFSDGEQVLNITPASCLLFSLSRMSNGKDRKQQQLQGLIKNSYQNRDSILSQKSNFYQKQSPLSNLNPSNQFRLRKLMDKKLIHRLQLSKQQINNFISYLTQIKNYHVILNDTILQILKQVRQNLLNGKVMKLQNLANIIVNKSKFQISKYPNQLILQKLASMMI